MPPLKCHKKKKTHKNVIYSQTETLKTLIWIISVRENNGRWKEFTVPRFHAFKLTNYKNKIIFYEIKDNITAKVFGLVCIAQEHMHVL